MMDNVNNLMDNFFDYAIENPIVYVAFILVCLFIIIGGLIFVSRKAERNQVCVKNPKGNLTTEQQQAINVGAIMGAMFGNYCNSLQTKLLRRATTMEGWGIHSSGTARETILYMINEGHREVFEQIKQYADARYVDKEDNPIFASARNKQFLKNLRSSIPLLLKEQIISSHEEIPQISMLAWDMGRLVNVTRWSYDLQYITEEEAWEAINFAYEQVKETYESWQEFAKAYLIGRAIWDGVGASFSLLSRSSTIPLKKVIRITGLLLEQENSPWKAVPFK